MGEIFTNYISDKGSRIFKELLELNNRKKTK